MDHFTKWFEIFPTPDQKARTVAQTLVSSLFGGVGPFQIIHSDQGRNVESDLMHEVCQIMGKINIEPLPITPSVMDWSKDKITRSKTCFQPSFPSIKTTGTLG